MKWLLITNQKTLKKKILKEFKRHPEVFDVIHNWKDFNFEDATNYNRIILGDDFWKQYRKSHRWDTPIGKLYWDLCHNSRNRSVHSPDGFILDIVSQCTECKRKGVRLDRTNDGRCKSCREANAKNPHVVIEEPDPEWIEKMESIEPKEVELINKRVPEELVTLTQEVIDKYFPEFKGINLRYTSTALGRSLMGWDIALNPNLLKRTEQETIHTIAHELTHQMCQHQMILRGRSEEVSYLYDQRIPHGELQTDMWTFARHPDLVSHGYFFYTDRELSEKLKEKHGGWNDAYSEEKRLYDNRHFAKHRNKIHELSKQALMHRKNGMINYRQWFRDEMKKINIAGNDGY